jgi:hypothetical protein
MKQLQVGDNVYVQSEYNMCKGKVVKINPKSVKITVAAHGFHIEFTRGFLFHKVAHEDESIAPIWESYKGVNGRGGYRIEREAYPEHRKPTNQWKWQEYLWEETPGIVRKR